MKKIFKITAMAILLSTGLTFTACDAGGSGGNVSGGYNIGDIGPSGAGTVFYITDGGKHGLEAAPRTWHNPDDDILAKWRTSGDGIAGTSDIIGSGYENTYTHLTGTSYVAAHMTRECILGGKTDWFLPSKDELNQLYLQKSVLGDFSPASYWSSSQSGEDFAYAKNFSTGSGSIAGTTLSNRCRPIRAF